MSFFTEIRKRPLFGLLFRGQKSGPDLKIPHFWDPFSILFFRFQKLHSDILLLRADKGPELIFMEKKEYQKRLRDLFDNSKFERVEDYSIRKDQIEYRKILRETLENCVSKKQFRKLAPKHSIAEVYGNVKLHEKTTHYAQSKLVIQP